MTKNQREALEREYARATPKLAKAYKKLTKTRRAHVEEIEFSFLDAVQGFAATDTTPFIEWARSVVPDAFPRDLFTRMADTERAAMEAAAGRSKITPAEPLPRTPEDAGCYGVSFNGKKTTRHLHGRNVWYHGTKAPEELLRLGYRSPPIGQMVDSDVGFSMKYDWDHLWRPAVWDWWKHLPREVKKRLEPHVGGAVKRGDDLSGLVGLWLTSRYDVAKTYTGSKGVVLEVDVQKIDRALGWFADVSGGIQEGNSIIILLEPEAPQVLPSAFKEGRP